MMSLGAKALTPRKASQISPFLCLAGASVNANIQLWGHFLRGAARDLPGDESLASTHFHCWGGGQGVSSQCIGGRGLHITLPDRELHVTRCCFLSLVLHCSARSRCSVLTERMNK